MRIVIEKVSGFFGVGFAGKGGGDTSTLVGAWTRSYVGACPHPGEFVDFGDGKARITQVNVVKSIILERYRKPPETIEPETAWCICRDGIPQEGDVVHQPSAWVDGLGAGMEEVA